MNRLTEALALSCLLVTALAFYTRIADQLPGLEREERDSLSVISHVLHDFGLHHRADVAVKLDARPVAAGFSLLDCDGLLLIASLPETAQGWGHLAPQIGRAHV